MRPGSLPIPQLILLDLIAPPVIATVWRFKAIGWARAVQGGKVSEETRARQRSEFYGLYVRGAYSKRKHKAGVQTLFTGDK